MNAKHKRRQFLSGLALAGLLVMTVASVAGAQTMRPSPSEAPNDRERLFADGCLAYEPDTRPRNDCVYGDPHGSYTLALIGDSHTSAIFPAFDKLGKLHHWKILPFVKINCPFLDIRIKSAHDFSYYPECETWNARVLNKLQSIHPDMTVTLPFRWIFPMSHSQDTPRKEGAAIGRMLAQVPGKRVVMVDTPWSDRDIPTCLKSHTRQYCAIPRSQAMTGGVPDRELEAADVGNAYYVNITSTFCPRFPCPVVTPGGILKYRDWHHFTATYSKSLAPAVYNVLAPIAGS
ncbi:MAG: hypothetical protein QOH61_1561 [Chloroflexota bacterium]|jgi:hypothetical protein|nr:hypothetical protein [Chloroflexota bacterium]